MYLSTEIKTDLVIMRDKTKIPVTKEEYHRILLAKQDGKITDFIQIFEGSKKIFHWELREIIWFEEIKQTDLTWLKWICGYWHSHAINEDCKCETFWKMSQWEFRKKAYEIFWNEKTIYMQDLTQEQKKTIYNSTGDTFSSSKNTQ